jgi:hypothetical protein
VTSAVLDAALALVLVSGAVVGVAATGTGGPVAGGGPSPAALGDGHPDPDPTDRRAARFAGSLSTATASVDYTLAPGAEHADGRGVEFPRTEGVGFRRSDHGTLAGLLARATVATVAVDGERLTRTRDDYARAVRGAVRAAADGSAVNVTAVWRPYPDSHVGSRLRVGPTPPGDRTVHAATVAVPSGVPSARSAARNASSGGFDAVAAVVADRLVAGLFPPRRANVALGRDYPVPRLVRYRYRRAGEAYGVRAAAPLADERVDVANGRLQAVLARAVERDLERRYDDPRRAAASLHLDRVRIVVRTWSR